MAPSMAPPVAPIAPPLTVRVPVVWPQPARVNPATRAKVNAVSFMLLVLQRLFARPFPRQAADRAVYGRFGHEFPVLLVRRPPGDERLDPVVPRGRRRIADQALQMMPVHHCIVVAHHAEK